MKTIPAALGIIVLLVNSACSSISASPTPTQNDIQPIAYYYIALRGDEISPTGSVTILADEVFLSPVETDQPVSSDVEGDLRNALDAMIKDPHNNQVVGEVTISSIAYNNGHADISMQGNVYAAGDIILIAVREMILLTVFSNTAVDTAVVTLNGKNIANLGVSFSGNAQPEDYEYTRSEIEEFMTQNAYPGNK